MEKVNYDRCCFVCGPENERGMKLDFELSPEAARAQVVFAAHLCGWQEIVHGGIVATVLDEAMAKAAQARGWHCLTAEMTVRYRIPANTGKQYTLCGTILSERGRIVNASAELSDQAGRVVAAAGGKLCRTDS